MGRAYRVYLFLSAATGFLYNLVFTVNLLYFVTVARLDALQLVLIGTTLEVAIFLFEIPTGVVADVYSRRLSVLIGLFIIGVGFVLEGAWPAFWPLATSQVLWGLGYTFTSGATQAWVSDEIGEERAGRAFVRGTQFDQLGALAAIPISVLLGNRWLQLPILVSGGLFLLVALGLSLPGVMPETGFRPTPQADRSNAQKLFHTFQQGAGIVRSRPALIAVLGVGFLLGLYSEGFDRLWTAHLLERFTLPNWFGLTQVTWFGLLGAAGMALSALAAGLLERRADLSHPRAIARLMTVFAALLAACLFLYPAAQNLWLALAALLSIGVLRRVIEPLYLAWVNHRLDPAVRATVLSMSSQVDAFGQIGGGPLVGLIARTYGLAAGLFSSAALFTPILALLGWQGKKESSEADRDPAA